MAETFSPTSAQAPGRICLLGDNADLIEKPAIAAAINAFLNISLSPREDDRVILNAEDINFREEFKLGDSLELDTPLKYLEAVYLRLQERIPYGFEAVINSQIPVSAGMSSSTALCIAFIRVLSRAYKFNLGAAEIAELSYLIERQDLGIECGRMDQYAIAFGGVTYINTGPDAGVEKIPVASLPVIVADTQDTHSTQELQEWLQNRLREKDEELIDSLMRVVNLVEQGRQALLKDDLVGLGKLMTEQQKEENIMGTSTDRLNLLQKTALKAGAWGAKQMGAGGGGCIVALCPPDLKPAVQSALKALEAPCWDFEIYKNEQDQG
jgi:mevalonate kinase